MSAVEGNPLAVTTARSRRRKLWGKVMEGLASFAALVAIAVLVIVIASVAKRGFPALSVDFFTKVPAPFGESGGGIANSIVGTCIMTGLATLIALPAGVLIAIFNAEFAPERLAVAIRITLNVLAGVPTIVVGVFIAGLIVSGRGYSAWAAAIALSVIMLPIVARSVEEVLLLVPNSLREGSMALGATRARTVLTVILPTTAGGIVTATILAVARAAGETAPLLFTTAVFANAIVTDPSVGMSSIPMSIFTNSESPSQADQATAWAAALVLLTVVLISSIIGRLLSLRTRRQIAHMR